MPFQYPAFVFHLTTIAGFESYLSVDDFLPLLYICLYQCVFPFMIFFFILVAFSFPPREVPLPPYAAGAAQEIATITTTTKTKDKKKKKKKKRTKGERKGPAAELKRVVGNNSVPPAIFYFFG